MVSKSKIGCPNHEYWKIQRDWCLSSSHKKNWGEFVKNIQVCFEEDGVYRLSRLVEDWYTSIGWGISDSDALELMQTIISDTPIGVWVRIGRDVWFCDMRKTGDEVSIQIDNQKTDNLTINI